MSIRIKMCGMTRLEDALYAAKLGVDAIGLIFHPPAQGRAVTIKQAQGIVAGLPPFITTVGVFVNATHEEITEILSQVSLDLLQFHGNEPAEACRLYQRPYIKTIAMVPGVDILSIIENYPDAKAMLLDSQKIGQAGGGTGETFDWSKIPAHLPKPIILAGGLKPSNVRLAIESVHPFAVDVTSGIEATRGIKDPTKMEEFVRNVRYNQPL